MSHNIRRMARWACLVSALGVSGVAILAGCGDDDDDTPNPGTGDSGTVDARTDTGPTDPDGGEAPDSTAPDGGGDAGPTITTTIGSTGNIAVTRTGAVAEFYEDDTILHTSDSPGCVAFIRSGAKPKSSAGDLTVGGDRVGTPGGPAAALVAQPDTASGDPVGFNLYFAFVNDGEELFAGPGKNEAVQVQLAGATAFPSLPVTTFRAPIAETVDLLQPQPPDAGVVVIDSTKPLVVKWAVPTPDAGGVAGQNVVFGTQQTALTTNDKTAVNFQCSWPLAAGTGTISSAFFSYIKSRAGTEVLNGVIGINPGDFKEIASAGASYIVTVSPLATTDTPGFELR